MTELESPKKNNDCYFYYYSTCSKGDSCGFRHEPSALGCETVCSFWKEGKCVNVHCNFRHMELRKNRKAIQCYWETQPGGCLKPHCPFMHKATRDVPLVLSQSVQADKIFPDKCSETETYKPSSAVDSLVVNFEEESDNESTSPSPEKLHASVTEKTLDEIQLEKIQEACAAYYSYPVESESSELQDDLRQRIWNRLNPVGMELEEELEQISWKRKQRFSEETRFKRQKVVRHINLDDIKIKSLAEIRAEKAKRYEEEFLQESEIDVNITPKTQATKPEVKESVSVSEDEVSSTCPDEDPPLQPISEQVLKPIRKLNLKKIKTSGSVDECTVSSNQRENEDKMEKQETAQENTDILEAKSITEERILLGGEVKPNQETPKENIESLIFLKALTEEQTLLGSEKHNKDVLVKETFDSLVINPSIEKRILLCDEKLDEEGLVNNALVSEKNVDLRETSGRTSVDETLLLEGNDCDEDMASKTEDDLLNDIDELLKE